MWWNRVAYTIISAAAVATFILTDNNVALFLCVCLLVLPLVSLVLLFIAVKKVKFDYEMREACIRGGALQISMNATLRPRILAGQIIVTAEIVNSTFHKTEIKKFVFKDLSGAEHVYDYLSDYSGRISMRIKSLKVVEIFGIFSIGVKCPKFAESIVSPVLYEDINVRVGARGAASNYGEIPLPEKGTDHTEIFNVRDYVAGDTLNSIHWKLSGKLGSLITKEYGSSDDHKTLILVDMSRKKTGEAATDGQLNGILDVTVSVSQALKAEGYIHSVGWFDNGVFCCSEVADSNSFVQMVYALMSIKVAEDNAQQIFYMLRSPECAAFTRVIFVTSGIVAEELKQCDSSITAVCIGKTSGEASDGISKIIYIPQDDVGGALSSCVL